jgi:hypothetical protein
MGEASLDHIEEAECIIDGMVSTEIAGILLIATTLMQIIF